MKRRIAALLLAGILASQGSLYAVAENSVDDAVAVEVQEERGEDAEEYWDGSGDDSILELPDEEIEEPYTGDDKDTEEEGKDRTEILTIEEILDLSELTGDISGEEQEILTAGGGEQTYVPDADDLPDNDELFAGYVARVFSGDTGIATLGNYGESKLKGLNAKIYQALKTKIAGVASGAESSTAFTLTWNDLDITKTSWTEDELGVTIFENGKISSEAMAAVLGKIGYDPNTVSDIVDCLLADCPYELYWFDKTKGCSSPGLNFSASGASICLTDSGLTFNFVVASAYAGSGNYTTDTAKTTAAAAAADNAKSVISSNADKADYEKLTAYKDYICKEVSYNHDAASTTYTGGYGDPWQLIYVFDGDSNTNVVCEGYSKAFQYLCDMSDLICYSVTGSMAGGTGAGAHMWNIVTLDGANYLADVTNSDAGSVGQGGELFLVGNGSGSADVGYSFTISGQTISFTYDEDTKSLYGNNILTLAYENYTYYSCEHIWQYKDNGDGTHSKDCSKCGQTVTEVHSYGSGKITKEATCTETGEKTYTCANCSATKTETIAATGHNYGAGKITKEATCTETGVKTYTCANCSATKTETIAVTGHNYDAGKVTKEATCTETGEKTYTCTECGATKTETIAATGAHTWGTWTTLSAATVFAAETQQSTCSLCKTTQTRTHGSKLASTLSLNASSLKLKKGQSTSALKVSGMADGDSVKSVVSGNTKVLKVVSYSGDGSIKLKAQKKTGSAKLTIMLAGGATKSITVKVQSGTVKTTKVKVDFKKMTLSKGSKTTLTPVITPITSQQKATYKSSNKKVATVSSKGVVTAQKAGTAKITVKSGSKKVTVTVKVTAK